MNQPASILSDLPPHAFLRWDQLHSPGGICDRESAKSRCVRSGGFSLIELLTVISLMAVLLSIAAPALSGMTKGRGVDAAINQSSGVVSLARSAALLHREGARVLIDIDPTSPGYLRRMGVVRGARQADGTVSWVSAGAPQKLPENVFFFQSRSNGFQTMRFDFKNADAQDGTGVGGDFAYFEYDGSGRFVAPSGTGLARFVLAPGFLKPSAGGNSELVVPPVNEAAMGGFILRKAGHMTYFRSAEQIEEL